MENIDEQAATTPPIEDTETGQASVQAVSPDQIFGNMEDTLPDFREDEAPAASSELQTPDPASMQAPEAEKISHGHTHVDPMTGTKVELPASHDSKGTAYIHKLHEPRFKKDGTWAKRRGNGGKVAEKEYYDWLQQQHRQEPENLKLPDENGELLPDDERERRVRAAEDEARAATCLAMAVGGFDLAQLTMGDEWKPQSGEIDVLSGAIEPVLIESGYKGWGPKTNLMMVLIGIGAKRFNKPVTKSRLSRAWSWTKLKLHGARHWMGGKRRQEQREKDPYAVPDIAEQAEAS